MSELFKSIQIGKLELNNRIIIAPMCQYSAENGSASDWHLIHLGSLALSGAGLLIIEATAVSPEGRISPSDVGLYSDANEAALTRTLAAIRQYSPMPLAVQLAHAGRKACTRPPWEGGKQIAPHEKNGWQTVAPSAEPYLASDVAPQALDLSGIKRVRTAFVESALRAVRAGFKGIEIHGAHGYLLHEFMSPLTNKRTDEYGGDLAKRMRFPLEVFEAVRAAVPSEIPVWMRISATDWVAGGWDLESSIVLAKELQRRGCDAIHVSTGGLSTAQEVKLGPGYQVAFASAIKNAVGLLTIAVGLITEAEHAESIIAKGEADAVGVARVMLYNPHWPWQAAAKLGASVIAPKQYWRSQPQEIANLFTTNLKT